jgi:shikimate dehydrogenase
MSKILGVIENKNLNLEATEAYAAILGESPSKGARSPLLWNHAFEELDIAGFMHPMDVVSDKLEAVVQCLREDRRFIGGAVTIPYKIDIIPFLDALEPEAETIGAVNCLYRQGNKIIGANTDGAGALWSLQKEIGSSLNGKTVLLLGSGGAGFAVAAYIASALETKGKLLIANRSSMPRCKIIERLKCKCSIENIKTWPVSLESLKQVDIVVNCTSIGFQALRKDNKGLYSLKLYTPLGGVDDNIRVVDTLDAEAQYVMAAGKAIADNCHGTLSSLSFMNRPFVFDIIYQPVQTLLLSLASLLGCRTLNGLPMNLEQAVIAFVKVTTSAGLFRGKAEDVRPIMCNN